ncbi:metallophosphoesterase [Candidatus Thorarchaeota archaeon]|nr:MAG: metallophosphoesterase [Candidatus Thorarchaeota archaeon]
MKILTMTDLHGTYPVVPKLARIAESEGVDAIVVAGDITNFGPVSVASQIVRGLLVVGVPVLWIPGNCDPADLYTHPSMPPYSLHFQKHELQDTLFIGLGGTIPSPFPGMLEFSEDTYRQQTLNLVGSSGFEDLFIISHSPPFGTSADTIYSGEHVGSNALRDLALQLKPRAILCGHIHESRGIDRIEESLVVNPGPAMNGHYAIVEGRKDEWNARLESTD